MFTLTLPLWREFRSDLVSQRLDLPPRMDVYRRDDGLVVLVDLPGVDPETIDVTADGGWLSIVAERRLDEDPYDRSLLAERPFGRFERRCRVADVIDVAAASATYRDGVLRLELPVRSSTQTRIGVRLVTDAEPAHVDPASGRSED